jgi:hypothetical protein
MTSDVCAFYLSHLLKQCRPESSKIGAVYHHSVYTESNVAWKLPYETQSDSCFKPDADCLDWKRSGQRLQPE